MKKIGILLLVVLVGLGILSFVAGKIAGSYLTPDFLVQQLESSLGCRAEIDSVKVSLLGSANIRIEGLSLGVRDENVENGKPHSERLPMAKRDIQVKSMSLKVKPLDLIRRRLYIAHLVLDGIDVRMVTRKDGSTSIDDLFSEMGKNDDQNELNAQGDGSADSTRTDMIPMAIKADRVEVTNSKVTVDIEASGSRVSLQNAGFGFSEIDIDPDDLSVHNQAKFKFTGVVSIAGKDENASKIFDAKLSGAGEIRPFDPSRELWAPNWTSTITLQKGSRLDTVPLLSKLKEALAKINKMGLDLSGLLIDGELAEDATTEISHKRGRYQFEAPMVLDFVDTQLELHKGSWINAAANKHNITCAVTSSEQFTKEIQGKAEKYLSKQIGGQLSGGLIQTLFTPITKNGRIHLEVVSSGDLSHPKADIVTPIGKIGNLGDMFKKSGSTGNDLLKIGKGLLDGFFKKK